MPVKLLPVPYFIQPTAVTCQSTCLKMMSVYLEREIVLQSTGAEAISIAQIWSEVNSGPGRPSAVLNAHANFKWWLERRFSGLRFEYTTWSNEADAAKAITQSIDLRMPVLASVSHERVAGHIVLVVGYEGYQPRMSSIGFQLVVHDPYGRFDPLLDSQLYGGRRMTGALSLTSGGELGPGQQVRVPISALGRRRSGDASAGTFFLLAPRRA